MGEVYDAQDAAEESADVIAVPEQPVGERPAEGRERDEHGRFVKQADTEQEQETDPAPADESEPETAIAVAPVSWSAEEKAVFAELPPEVQDIIARRESERDKGFSQKAEQLSERAKSYESLETILGPRRARFAADGMTDAQAVKQLFDVADFATRDPETFIRQFAEARGIKLGQQTAGEVEDDFTDPVIAEMRTELARLKAEIAESRTAQQEALHQRNTQTIEQFRNAKDERGNPKHPHFETVRQEMAARIKSGMSDSLESAYEAAVWALPTVREEVLRAQRASAEAKRLAEAKAAASKAAKARGTVAKPRSGEVSKPASRTIEETMSAAYDAQQGA